MLLLRLQTQRWHVVTVMQLLPKAFYIHTSVWHKARVTDCKASSGRLKFCSAYISTCIERKSDRWSRDCIKEGMIKWIYHTGCMVIDAHPLILVPKPIWNHYLISMLLKQKEINYSPEKVRQSIFPGNSVYCASFQILLSKNSLQIQTLAMP